jgi:Leucine-rich repeat (LRR) protein
MNKATSIISIILFFIHSLSASVDPLEMKGLYYCFQNNKKHTSPFNGMVWSKARLPEKFYHFGNAQVEMGTSGEGRNIPVVKKIVGGDFNIQLALSLFYALGNEFGPSKEPSNPAFYLTATDIGQMITLMNKATETFDEPMFRSFFETIFRDAIDQKKMSENEKKDFVTIKRTLYNLKKDFFWNSTYAAFFNDPKNEKIATLFGKDQAGTLQWIKAITTAKIDTLFKFLAKEYQEIAKVPHKKINEVRQQLIDKKINDLAKKFEQKSTHEKHAIQAIKELATIVIGALKESGNIKSDLEQKYPLHTPYFLILSLLYEKAQKVDDLYAYCNALPKEYLKNKWLDIIQTAKNLNVNLPTLVENLCKSQFNQKTINLTYENLCFAEIQGQIQRQTLPLFSKFKEISLVTNMGQISFDPCVEIAIYNWILVLLTRLGLYDKATQTFNTNNLLNSLKTLCDQKKIPFDEKKLEPLKAFFEKYNKAIPLNEQAIIEWSKLVSNIPGIKYYQAKKKDAEAIIEKEYKTAMLHLEPDIKDATIYGTNVKALDKSFYLYEAAGNPSTYVKLTNHLLGLQCKTFEEICNLFELNGDKLELIDDNHLYANTPTTITTDLNGSIEKNSFKIKISFTKGHSACSNISMHSGKSGTRAAEINLRSDDTIVRFVITHYDTNFINQNLAALYLNITPINFESILAVQSFESYYRVLTETWNTNHYLMQIFLLSSNLFDTKISLLILEESPYLTPILLKKINELITDKNTDAIKDIFSNNTTVERLLLNFDYEIIKRFQETLQQPLPTTMLIMQKRKLEAIPEGVFLLTKLTYLDLSNNKLEDLPAELKTLQNLKHLNLSHNLFEKIPQVLIVMQDQFEELNLGDNKISPLDMLQYLPKWLLTMGYNTNFRSLSKDEKKKAWTLLAPILEDLWKKKENSQYYSVELAESIHNPLIYLNLLKMLCGKLINPQKLDDFYRQCLLSKQLKSPEEQAPAQPAQLILPTQPQPQTTKTPVVEELKQK